MHVLSDFFRLQVAGAVLLISAALLALLFANSPLEEIYEGFQEMPVAIVFGELQIAKPMLLWVNDGAMAVFFLLVALELKREALCGQLSSRGQIFLPLLCAAGGVIVPAVIFWTINRSDPVAMQGWAVPAATDIAFALGVLALLGSRVPLGMKVLLSTIAVVDDLAAIFIIALFYSSGLSLTALAWASIAIAMMLLLNRRGVRALTPYLVLGVVVWLCVLESGMHATLAGVVTGLMVPHLDRRDGSKEGNGFSPLEALESALHPWVAYGILPVFAFVNAGLALGDFTFSDSLAPVPLGIVLGLVLGKPAGVVAAAVLARATGIARFPEGVDLKAMFGVGLLCGIGFTMSLFIGSLAFSDDGDLFQSSVLGVLCASVLAAIAGYTWLRMTLPKKS